MTLLVPSRFVLHVGGEYIRHHMFVHVATWQQFCVLLPPAKFHSGHGGQRAAEHENCNSVSRGGDGNDADSKDNGELPGTASATPSSPSNAATNIEEGEIVTPFFPAPNASKAVANISSDIRQGATANVLEDSRPRRRSIFSLVTGSGRTSCKSP